MAAGPAPGTGGEPTPPVNSESLVLPRIATPPRRSRARKESTEERGDTEPTSPAKKEKKSDKPEKEKRAKKEKKEKSSRRKGSESHQERSRVTTPEARGGAPDEEERKSKETSRTPGKKEKKTRKREKEDSPEKVATKVKEEVDYHGGPVSTVREVSLSTEEVEKESPEQSPREEERARSSGLHRQKDSRGRSREKSEGVRLRGKTPERSRTRSRTRRRKTRTPDKRRPRSPSREPVQRWPQPPPGPPPGYFNYGYPGWAYWSGASRSKGIQRRLRNDDIRQHGTDPGRKTERVHYQYSKQYR